MSAIPAGMTELIAGDFAAAEQILRHGVETLHAMGERGYRSTAVAFLAEALAAQVPSGAIASAARAGHLTLRVRNIKSKLDLSKILN